MLILILKNKGTYAPVILKYRERRYLLCNYKQTLLPNFCPSSQAFLHKRGCLSDEGSSKDHVRLQHEKQVAAMSDAALKLL